MSNESKNRTVLVTGGSSGIGKCIVIKLAREGYRVVTCARRTERLEELKEVLESEGIEIFPIGVELKDEASIILMFEEIRRRFDGVEVLVNGAGLGYLAPLLSSPSEPWRETLEVNIMALSICTREAVRDMQRLGDQGHVVNISSLLGYCVGNFPGMYTATKFAVRALSESVRLELRSLKSKIRVSQVSPGRVETEFHAKYFQEGKKAEAMYAEYRALQGDDIAGAVSFILSQPEHVNVDDILISATEQA